MRQTLFEALTSRKAGQLRHCYARIQVEIIHDDDSVKLSQVVHASDYYKFRIKEHRFI